MSCSFVSQTIVALFFTNPSSACGTLTVISFKFLLFMIEKTNAEKERITAKASTIAMPSIPSSSIITSYFAFKFNAEYEYDE